MTQNIAVLGDFDGHSDVLIEYTKEKGAKGIKVPDNCDLALNRYFWDSNRFVPLPTKTPEAINMADDAVYCIASALQAIREGKDLPDHTLMWLDHYFEQFDDKGKV